MGQVPAEKINSPFYLLIGSGQLAFHLKNYFSALGLNFYKWSRNNNLAFNSISPLHKPNAEDRLIELTQACSHILLLISDNQIDTFVQSHPFLKEKVLIHCSGALSLPGINSAHPLMTFTGSAYSLNTYLQMTFVTETGKKSFHQLFPQLANPNLIINSELKPLYHALCVIGGNASSLIWQKVAHEMSSTLGIPVENLKPYMECIFNNILATPNKAVTGPLVRKDWLTIEKNLTALKGHPLENIYKDLLQLTMDNYPKQAPQAFKEELC